jgi:hypothetical protein
MCRHFQAIQRAKDSQLELICQMYIYSNAAMYLLPLLSSASPTPLSNAAGFALHGHSLHDLNFRSNLTKPATTSANASVPPRLNFQAFLQETLDPDSSWRSVGERDLAWQVAVNLASREQQSIRNRISGSRNRNL